jgi:hypothetical protein
MTDKHLEQEIRDWIRRYSDAEIDLAAFKEWFAPSTWDVHHADPAAAEFAYAVDALLARAVGEAQLKRQLVDCAHRRAIAVAKPLLEIAVADEAWPLIDGVAIPKALKRAVKPAPKLASVH